MDNNSDVNNSALSLLSLNTPVVTRQSQLANEDKVLKCLCCKETYKIPSLKDDYLAHLYLSHRLIIADVDDIADIVKYLDYWINALKDNELEVFCTTLLLDQLPDGTPAKNEKYYLLSDILPKDFELRKTLHKERLQQILAQYQFERTDRTFSHECLFCRDVINGLRADYLNHLSNKHSLQLGKPEKLVFIDELIHTIQNKLENLICIFCEKTFKNRTALKEHMRKKGHKRINPKIKFYDKFFLIQYKIEKPQNVKNIKNRQRSNNNSCNKSMNTRSRSKSAPKAVVKKTPSSTTAGEHPSSSSGQQNNQQRSAEQDSAEKILNSGDDSDSNWSDWDDEQQTLTCLFCSIKEGNFDSLKKHMTIGHSFDFDKITEKLNFYQKIKIINYIRRQVHILRCVSCNEHCENIELLQTHMKNEKHFDIGDKNQWDKPEYFFPTYEDDAILYFLEDRNNTEDDSSVVIGEDLRGTVNTEAEKLSLENFVLPF